VSIADVASGMYAYSGILMAIIQRARTGHGTRVDVSMLDALAEWMSQPMYFGRYGGAAPGRTGASHPTIAPYGPHRAGDGRDVLLGIQNEREWIVFCSDVLAQPDLARDERFVNNTQRTANRIDLTRIIEHAFASHTVEDVVERLDRSAIANGRLNSIDELVAHPQLAARDRWREIGTNAGPIAALRPPANLDGVDAYMGNVPAVGEHTNAILTELGYTSETIDAMRASGAI
jgi:itaconate CoA-transferase